MSMEKVYCIVKKQGDIYFPIKAKEGPYTDEEGKLKVSYLAGMPNFFGGTVKAGENRFSALIRELAEESQDNIVLRESTDWTSRNRVERKRGAMESACREILPRMPIQDRPDLPGNPETDYYFYLFDADQYEQKAGAAVTITGFAGSIAVLSTATRGKNGAKHRREMSCILKVSADQCTDIDAFLQECKRIDSSDQYMKSIADITVRGSQWHDVGTKNAFMAFCEKRAELMRNDIS